jgi:hypothetical protein
MTEDRLFAVLCRRRHGEPQVRAALNDALRSGLARRVGNVYCLASTRARDTDLGR